MRNRGRILHLGHDDKFIDEALEIFESVAPGKNDLLIVSKKKPVWVSFPARTLRSIRALLTRGGIKEGGYIGIVVHSLNPFWYRTLLKVNGKVTIVWLGWGYDYYKILSPSLGKLVLPRTESLLHDIHGRSFIGRLTKPKSTLVKSWREKNFKKLLGRIDYFAPVLPNEYVLVRDSTAGDRFPKQLLWAYSGNIDTVLHETKIKKRHGNDILVGNNAHPENNHLEAFDILKSYELGNKNIVAPLSYGNDLYTQAIINVGNRLFGQSFQPLTEFMSLQDYIERLKTCGFAIMNHVRQQGLGNIVIMLCLGAKIFLRKECPTYQFLKERGAVVYTVDDLKFNVGLLNDRLDEASVQNNRAVVRSTWSRTASIQMAEVIVNIFNNKFRIDEGCGGV